MAENKWYDHAEVDAKVKALGESQIVIGVQTEEGGFMPSTAPITLHELIHYIHQTGASVSSHLNTMEHKALNEKRS